MDLSSDRKTVNGYVTDDSESDFVDVTDLKTYNNGKESGDASDRPEICVNGDPLQRCKVTATVERSQTVRSSLKSPRVKDQEELRKRTISFNLHEVKPQVSIEPPNDERLRNLFTSSRWSTSSTSSSDSCRKSTSLDLDELAKETTSSQPRVESQESNEGATSNAKSFEKSKAMRLAAMKKSKSLKTDPSRRSVDIIVKRRYSTGDRTPTQSSQLRDSAIDLISDEENSEVYTAVSLAGTLKRNAQPVQEKGINRKYVIIGAVTGFVAALAIIIILAVLLASKE